MGDREWPGSQVVRENGVAILLNSCEAPFTLHSMWTAPPGILQCQQPWANILCKPDVMPSLRKGWDWASFREIWRKSISGRGNSKSKGTEAGKVTEIKSTVSGDIQPWNQIPELALGSTWVNSTSPGKMRPIIPPLFWLLWELNEIMHVKCLSLCLSHNKWSIIGCFSCFNGH